MSIIGDYILLGGGASNLRCPAIIVTSDTGATVTATKGLFSVTLTEYETGKYYGEVTDYGTWTVSASKSGDTASATVDVMEVKVYEVAVRFVSTILNDNDWATIGAVSQAGEGANYWSIGDCKQITLNGTVGTKAYSNVSLCVFIIHFNMPTNKTVADNNIIWQGFKTALTGGADVALDDSMYNSNSTNGTKYFNMNHSGETNFGGWKGCDLRYDVLGACSSKSEDASASTLTTPQSNTLLAALPSDLLSVIRLWTHYVDNSGNWSNVDANVTAVTDAISLLAEFEICGARSFANEYEQNHQVQCSYYANGNSKVKNRQSASTTAAMWWISSALYYSATVFCAVLTNGSANTAMAYTSIALAPVFKT